MASARVPESSHLLRRRALIPHSPAAAVAGRTMGTSRMGQLMIAAIGQHPGERLRHSPDEILETEGEGEDLALPAEVHAHRRQKEAEAMAYAHGDHDHEAAANEHGRG